MVAKREMATELLAPRDTDIQMMGWIGFQSLESRTPRNSKIAFVTIPHALEAHYCFSERVVR